MLHARLAARRQSRHPALLHDPEFVDDVVGALLEARIARHGEHQADGREVVAGDVSGELAAVGIPARIALRLRLRPARVR